MHGARSSQGVGVAGGAAPEKRADALSAARVGNGCSAAEKLATGGAETQEEAHALRIKNFGEAARAKKAARRRVASGGGGVLERLFFVRGGARKASSSGSDGPAVQGAPGQLQHGHPDQRLGAVRAGRKLLQDAVRRIVHGTSSRCGLVGRRHREVHAAARHRERTIPMPDHIHIIHVEQEAAPSGERASRAGHGRGANYLLEIEKDRRRLGTPPSSSRTVSRSAR